MSPTEFTHSPVIPIAAPFDLTDYPELAGISGISGTGLVTRISVGSYATRTLTGTTNQVNVADGNGVSGNPTISLPQNIHTAATPTFAGMTLNGMTSGSVLFAGTGGVVSQDNSNLFWDNTNNRLGIGLGYSPNYRLDVGNTQAIAKIGGFTDTGIFFNRYADNDYWIGFNTTWNGTASVAKSTETAAIECAAGRLNFFTNSGLVVGNTFTGTQRLAITTLGNILVSNPTETAAGGLIQLATGTTAATGILWGTDTNLYRSAANTLKTDDSLIVTSVLGVGAAAGNGTLLKITDNTNGTMRISIPSANTYRIAANTGDINFGFQATDGGAFTQRVQIRSADAAMVLSGPAAGTTLRSADASNSTFRFSHPASLVCAITTPNTTVMTFGAQATDGAAVTEYVRFSNITGNTMFGTSTDTVGGGLIQLSTNASATTAAFGILFGTDTNLYRSAANTLKTDDTFRVATDVEIIPTASANRYITLTGSNGGNPTIGTSAGNLYLSSNTVIGASGISPASYEKLWVSGTDARIRIDNNGGSGGGYYNYSGGTLMGSVAHTGSAFAVTSSGANLTLNGAGGSNQILLQSNAVTQVRIDYTVGANRFITLTGSNGGNPTIDVSAGSLAITPATVFASTITTIGGANFHTTSTALTDGAGAGAGTLTNAPAAGDPTKWIGINDNGTTRYIPAW